MTKWDLSLECKAGLTSFKSIKINQCNIQNEGGENIIILIDEEKSLDKIQHLFIVKLLN